MARTVVKIFLNSPLRGQDIQVPSGHGASTHLDRKRVMGMAMESLLVVENEPVTRVAMTQWLSTAGYPVESAASGQEALDKLKEREYDLLLVELNMPKMDGLQFLSTSREINTQAGALVITGYRNMGRVIKSMDEGALGFIIKPFYPEQLLQSVQVALAKQSLTREKQRRDAFKPFLEVSRLLLKNGDLPTFGEMFLANLMSVTAAAKAAIFVVIDDGLELLGSKGFGEAPSAPNTDQVQEMGKVLRNVGDSLISNGGAFSWPQLQAIGIEPAQELCIPLHLLGRINGLVVVGGKGHGQAFSQSDVEFLWICSAVTSNIVEGFLTSGVPVASD